MFKAIANFFKRGEDKALISADENVVKKEFKKHRWSVFMSITLGYAFFYVCRLNFSVVKKQLLNDGICNAQQLGETSLMFLVHPTLTEESLKKTVNAIQQVIQMMNAINN